MLYAEISPRLDHHEDLTAWELRRGRLPSYQVLCDEVGERLRGCGWVTWLPQRFVDVLGEDNVRGSSAFCEVETIADRGLLVRASERAHEFIEAHERKVEEFLRPVVEPVN